MSMSQTPRTITPTEILAGLVERVTFHNDENGFCVLRVKARGQRDLITVLGHAAMISAGAFVQASDLLPYAPFWKCLVTSCSTTRRRPLS